MGDKATFNGQDNPPPYTSLVKEINPDCGDIIQNEDISKLDSTLQLIVPSAPVLDEIVLQENKKDRNTAKMELVKAERKIEMLQKERKILEELLNEKTVIDEEIKMILADLQLSEEMVDRFDVKHSLNQKTVRETLTLNESKSEKKSTNDARTSVLNGSNTITSSTSFVSETRSLPQSNFGIELLSTLTSVIVQIQYPKKISENIHICDINVITTNGTPVLKINGVKQFIIDGRYYINAEMFDSKDEKVGNIHSNSSDGIDVRVLNRLASIVKKRSFIWRPEFSINDATDNTVLHVKGSHQFQPQYPINNINKRRVGLLTMVKHTCIGSTNDDNMYRLPCLIEFPKELDVNFKVAIIAVRILMYNLFNM